MPSFITINYVDTTGSYEVRETENLFDAFDSYDDDGLGQIRRRCIVFVMRAEGSAEHANPLLQLPPPQLAEFVAIVNPDHYDLLPWFVGADSFSFPGPTFRAGYELIAIQLEEIKAARLDKATPHDPNSNRGERPKDDDPDASGGLGSRLAPPPPSRGPGYAQPLG